VPGLRAETRAWLKGDFFTQCNNNKNDKYNRSSHSVILPKLLLLQSQAILGQ